MQSELTLKMKEIMRQTFLLRMPDEMKKWLENNARKRGLTLTGLIMAILGEYIKQNKNN